MADPAREHSDAPQTGDPDHSHRATFGGNEAAAVLAHYALGPIRSIRALHRGSSKAPKALVVADSGEYLLKRRAAGKDTAGRIAFAHGLQLHLAGAGFPLARLVPATADHASVVNLQGHAYELFHFVHGVRYDASLPQTAEAGAILARLHALAASYTAPWPPTPGTYHNSPAIVRQLRAIPQRLIQPEVNTLVEKLVSVYARAAGAVERLGLARWPAQVVHNDWHPGNLLYDQGRVNAVLDFDAARIAPRAIDVANGALQFSMTLHATSPSTWPPGLDLPRLGAFLSGYDRTEGAILSRTELQALPWLMAEALIAEAAPPIAATGRFARLDGHEFLLMVDRLTGWIHERAGEIQNVLG
jgi:Ser/Thr protein kinase RdoA (MazF antagonist)